MKKILTLIFIFCFTISSNSQSIYDDLSRMNKKELRITRNTVFAKHGREFKTVDIKQYFESQIWYKINPNYSDDLLSYEDIKLINIIKLWENSPKLIAQKVIDLDGDNKFEYCFLLESIDSKKLFFLIDNHYEEINNTCDVSWDNILETFEVDSQLDIHNLKYSGINVLGFKRDSGDEGACGGIYHLVCFYDNEIQLLSLRYPYAKSPMLYNDFDKGTSYFVHEFGFCRNVKKEYYEFFHGKLLLIDTVEFYLSEDDYTEAEIWDMGRSCAACFVPNSKVLIDKNRSVLIKDLNVGDTVLSYDVVTKDYFKTVVLEMVTVDHENLVELYFNHDTITSTKDHPYFLYDKGWSSFDPNLTEYNYPNYDNINQIELNDDFVLSTGQKTRLLAYSMKDKMNETVTITKLAIGSTFFVNGILVGVEQICPEYAKLLKK